MPTAGRQGPNVAMDSAGTAHELQKLDALFPVLHGLFGEDGSVQGAADVARVPLVGCGILGSAVALDKRIAKQLLLGAGLPVARAATIQAHYRPTFSELRDELGLPIFIKPARQGSSVGVSKVASEAEYHAAVANGFSHDSVLLGERCGVCRSDRPPDRSWVG